MENGKKRLATLVGCNYPNTRNELHGCINDVLAMRDVLVNRFGFEPTNIELLTDAPGSLVMPTGVNIMSMLNQMVDRAEPGDVLFFHYSGHGTRIPSNHGFKHDEAIVPCDFNLITDMDFRRLVNRLPVGSTFTILSDSCHSGGLIDKEKEQIGPYVANPTLLSVLNCRSKIIPFDSILHHVSSLSGIQSSDISLHLLEVFGNEASIKFRSNAVQDNLGSPRSDSGILLSGCQANETSADMNPVIKGGKACGAFSNALQMVLKEHGTRISNREMIIHTREILQAQGFDQHPCLYCSDENAEAPFLWQPESSITKDD
ncbi:Peptidase C14 [Macleaya cordata]|uniref:Peptidase C14 n=1 Tax=Macleaya cordata TaxID=56857 RepID=A0A200RA12_MACCD|nr:Peptidase C14 [Macleaya cordata]